MSYFMRVTILCRVICFLPFIFSYHYSRIIVVYFWRSESTRRQRRYNLSLERYMRIRDVTLMMQSSCLWADGWIMVGLHLNSFIFPVSDSCVPLSQKIPVSCDKNVSCPVGELFSNNNWRGGGLFDILETVWNLVFVVISLTKFDLQLLYKSLRVI